MADGDQVMYVDKVSSMSKFWIVGNDGKPSMSATFASIAFFTTTVIYIVSIFEKIGPLTIRPFDSGAASAYLIPSLGLYFGRRWTEANSTNGNSGQ
jgi:hypothetical protein